MGGKGARGIHVRIQSRIGEVSWGGLGGLFSKGLGHQGEVHKDTRRKRLKGRSISNIVHHSTKIYPGGG